MFSLLLQCPSTCHSLSWDLYLSPSSSWGHWWQLAAADACGPSRSPSRAEPLQAPAWWRRSPWSQVPAPPGAPPPASRARLPAPAPAPTRGPGLHQRGPRPTAACQKGPWIMSTSTCPRTSRCWTASRPRRSCRTRASTCTRSTWATPCSTTRCRWPRCPPSWTACRAATGRSSPLSHTPTASRRCTQLWLCSADTFPSPSPPSQF